MSTSYKSAGFILFVILIATISLLAGCGGSGGGSDGLSSSPAAGSGSVALLLADDPTDDYDRILIKVSRVLLLPSDTNPNKSPVVIYESAKGHEVDLLELRDQDLLLTVKKNVPAGWYSKVRLEILDIRSEGVGSCEYFKLPSNRIDLNPRGDFEIRAGQAISIRLDIDANKSINLHEAGNSGKCIFRPVVFVEIDTIVTPQRCPRLLIGDIISLVENERRGVVEGFSLNLRDNRGLIDVWLSNDSVQTTIVFGEDGNRVRPNALEPGQEVRVRGKITSNGDLEASVVVIGDVLNVRGIVVSSVDSDSIFPLKLDPGQQLFGDQVKVNVTNATLVLLECDQEVRTDAIQRGKRAQVIGKFDVDEYVLRAIAVMLESEEITGDLLSLERATGGIDLIIEDQDGVRLSVFLPQEEPIYLQGDGVISLALLKQLLINCGPKKVRVALDPEETEPTAQEVRLQQDRLYGQLGEFEDVGNQVVRLKDGKLVKIQESATILLNTKLADIPVDFDSLKIGDEMTLYGLEACDGSEVDFYAYIVLINESAIK